MTMSLESATAGRNVRGSRPHIHCYRQGRFVVAELNGQHRVMSTSSRVGGMRSDIRYLVNHQSCEGAGHSMRGSFIMRLGMDGYHDSVCAELELDSIQRRGNGHRRKHGLRCT